MNLDVIFAGLIIVIVVADWAVEAPSASQEARWPWVLPPRAPTDPYVPTLEHTVPLMLDSPYS